MSKYWVLSGLCYVHSINYRGYTEIFVIKIIVVVRSKSIYRHMYQQIKTLIVTYEFPILNIGNFYNICC